jgi:hypothetical protein
METWTISMDNQQETRGQHDSHVPLTIEPRGFGFSNLQLRIIYSYIILWLGKTGFIFPGDTEGIATNLTETSETYHWGLPHYHTKDVRGYWQFSNKFLRGYWLLLQIETYDCDCELILCYNIHNVSGFLRTTGQDIICGRLVKTKRWRKVSRSSNFKTSAWDQHFFLLT